MNINRSKMLHQHSIRSFRSSNILLKKDYYSVLNVGRSSDPTDIKKAYFKKAKEFHPDVNKTAGAKEKFAEINEAYETLGDE
jgi:molecular chaperone DnaJ